MASRLEDFPQTDGLPAGSPEDKELALAFKRGDKGAYQAIHDRYTQRVYGVCRRMLTNPADAQEAAQETFLRVYQALGRFNGRYQLGPWITRIATNVCLDQIRSRARRPSDPVPNEILLLDESVVDHDSEPERAVIRNSESRHVRKVLASLPPMHRAAIVLRDFEGLSYEEVAVALQITDGQAKALIHRARQNFKRSWTKSLSILLPWRLAHKWRHLDGSARDHGAEAMSVAQSVSSCTGMLHQCGQSIGQNVATVVTAAIVGVGAGAASHAVTQPALPEKTAIETVSADKPSAVDAGVRKVLNQARARRAVAAETPTDDSSPTPAGEAPVPTVSPTPSEASPSPTDTPTETPSPDPAPEASSSPKPPPPFAPAVGFDYGRPVPGRAPISHSATVSCSKDVLDQRLETAVEDDDSGGTHPALLELSWGPETQGLLSLELTVWKNGHEIYYSGTGDLVDGSFADGRREMQFVGNYGTFNEQAKNMDLPASGRFSARLTLDCAALSVITESVVLGA